MDCMDAPELDMRVRLAELQHRYREKQKELAKLQRKHDQKEETPRSPARRGPGRPCKRKSLTPLCPGVFPEDQKTQKLLEACQSPAGDEHGEQDSLNKKKKLSNRGFSHPTSSQYFQRNGPQKITQKKQKGIAGQNISRSMIKGPESAYKSLFSASKREVPHLNITTESESMSDTATSGESGVKGSWKTLKPSGKRDIKKVAGSGTFFNQQGKRILFGRRQEVDKDEDISTAESKSSEQEEDEGSYGCEEAQDMKSTVFRDPPFSSAVTGPSSFSIVKLEANQKAKIKRERQELYLTGSQYAATEGDVKVRRQGAVTGVRRHSGRPRLQEKHWHDHYRKSSSSSERLKRATRKTSKIRATRSYWSSMDSEENYNTRRTRLREAKGRAVSRLMESFAADEGFHLGEDSSFSEEDERSKSKTKPALPNCILTKEMLNTGLKLLIADEEELLYAAQVQGLASPNVYSIVVERERGKRSMHYPLKKLLQEAVLDVRPELQTCLTEGTRVCAYWSERSRCLYPGYVGKGGDGAKSGGAMVEFDDGDRGWIATSNIRFLPPGYQIQCRSLKGAELSCLPEVQPGKSNSSLENRSLREKTTRTNRIRSQEKLVRRPGRPRGSGLKKCLSYSGTKCSSSALTWPSLTVPRKKSFLQSNASTSKKTSKASFPELSFQPPLCTTLTSKGLFSSSSFKVDSFRSIANGYPSFAIQTPGAYLETKSTLNVKKKGVENIQSPRGRKGKFLVKLDHEGVTSPKTKCSKALLLRGTSGFGSRGIGSLPRAEVYPHPVKLVKDNQKGDGFQADLLPKDKVIQKRSSTTAQLRNLNHRDSQSSSSDDEVKLERKSGSNSLAFTSGCLRNTGPFLSGVSISSPSSSSSSSSSSDSLSSSSLSSSENDSSFSSEDEDSSTLLLQSCLTSHHDVIQSSEPYSQKTFLAKAVTISNRKCGSGKHITSCKPRKRKKSQSSLNKSQHVPSDLTRSRVLPILPTRQLWRWSGNPTQRHEEKGKARKLFYKAVVRGKEVVRVGDCAVFLSSRQTHLPMIGRIQSFWQSWQRSMIVGVKWFYHPEETTLGKSHNNAKHALYQSSHEDENDVQAISHKCQVVSGEEYKRLIDRKKHDGTCHDLYFLAGRYEPCSGKILRENGISIL